MQVSTMSFEELKQALLNSLQELVEYKVIDKSYINETLVPLIEKIHNEDIKTLYNCLIGKTDETIINLPNIVDKSIKSYNRHSISSREQSIQHACQRFKRFLELAIELEKRIKNFDMPDEGKAQSSADAPSLGFRMSRS